MFDSCVTGLRTHSTFETTKLRTNRPSGLSRVMNAWELTLNPARLSRYAIKSKKFTLQVGSQEYIT